MIQASSSYVGKIMHTINKDWLINNLGKDMTQLYLIKFIDGIQFIQKLYH